MSKVSPEIADRRPPGEDLLRGLLARLVTAPHYPCVGARAVFHHDRATVRVYDELASPAVAPRLLEEVRAATGVGEVSADARQDP